MKYFREHKGLNLSDINKDILQYWEENNVFHRSVEERQGHRSFVFYEGPPSANGMPGIHHVMARTIKDVFCRFKTMQGYQVKRKAGWDTHGLPVELGVEKMLGITKEDIGKNISVEQYNDACRREVMKYTREWEDLTKKMGYWVDMTDPYITYDNRYIETLWYLLKQLYDKGLLYKGYTIQPYSPAAGTGLSTHELNQPGAYRDVKDTTCIAQFKVKNSTPQSQALIQKAGSEPVFFVAWTTTPWTLPSNTALAVGANIDYVLIKTQNQYTKQSVTVVLAESLLASVVGKNEYELLAKFSGKDMEGIEYEQLFDWVNPILAGSKLSAFRVICGDFVTTEDGTGIVHIAPTFGADDDKVAKQNGIAPLFVVDKKGDTRPMVDLTGKYFNISDLDDKKCLRPTSERCRRYSRRRHLYGAQATWTGIQDRETYPQLPALLAYGQTRIILSARLVVYPYYCGKRRNDCPQRYYQLEASIDRVGAFRQMARKPTRLELIA